MNQAYCDITTLDFFFLLLSIQALHVEFFVSMMLTEIF